VPNPPNPPPAAGAAAGCPKLKPEPVAGVFANFYIYNWFN
jgi:hypothetical protein